MNELPAKLKNLFFSTGTFFEKVKKEKAYFPILLNFVIVYSASVVAELIFSLPLISKIPTARSLLLISILGTIVSIALSFVLPFLAAGITHLGVLIMGGKEGYFNTFKPVTYAMIISAIYNIISYIISFFLNMAYPISPSALQQAGFALRDIPVQHIFMGIVIGIASLVHVIYAEVVGISKFQKMSKPMAFFAAIIIPLVMVIIAVLLIIAILGALLGISFMSMFGRIGL